MMKKIGKEDRLAKRRALKRFDAEMAEAMRLTKKVMRKLKRT